MTHITNNEYPQHDVLIIPGASGLAFIEVSQALPKPPHLILYVRSPAKLPSDISTNPNISIVTGELSDYDTLSSSMKDKSVTTVVSFLGAYFSASAIVARPTDTPIADSFPTITQAMKENGVKRLIVLSTPSYWVKEKDVGTWTLSLYGLMPKLFTPQGNAEMVAIAEAVASHATNLDWTIFRVPHLTDGPVEVPVWAGYAGPNHKGGLNLSRRSLARWVLGEIQEREWIRGVPFLSNY